LPRKLTNVSCIEEGQHPEEARSQSTPSQPEVSLTDKTYDWAEDRINDYVDIKAKNLKRLKLEGAKAWKDGVLLSHLVHSVDPDAIDLKDIKNQTDQERLANALEKAHDLGVPKMLDPKDEMEENSLIVYLNVFKTTVEDPKNKHIPAKDKASEPKEEIEILPTEVVVAPDLPPPKPVVAKIVEKPKKETIVPHYSIQTPKGGTVGKKVQFVITAQDDDGNPVPVDYNNAFGFKVHGVGTPKATIVEAGNGEYIVEFEPPSTGDYTLEVLEHGNKLFTEKIKALPAKKLPTTVVFTCKGLDDIRKMDETSTFDIVLEHKDGKPYDAEISRFSFDITGPERRPATITQKAANVCSVEWKAHKPGDYFIDVKFQGESVYDEPLQVNWAPRADSSKSYATGPAKVQPGKKFIFQIFAKDSQMAPIPRGGDPFNIEIEGPESSLGGTLVKDNDNGTYTVETKFLKPKAEHKIIIEVYGNPISNSPLTIRTE